jgi:hypothetical protein
MQGWDYPPYPYLEIVLKTCPKAARLYLKLWRDRDENHALIIDRKEIKKQFLLTPGALLDKLMLLAEEGLVCVYEHPTLLRIELTEWNDDTTAMPM